MPDMLPCAAYGAAVRYGCFRQQLQSRLAAFCGDPVVSRGTSLGERHLEFLVLAHSDFRAVRALIVLHGSSLIVWREKLPTLCGTRHPRHCPGTTAAVRCFRAPIGRACA